MTKKLRAKSFTESSRQLDHSVFSFFSGAGFLDLGFEKEGFEIVLMNEISKSFTEAYVYGRDKLGIESPKYGYHQESIEVFLEEAHRLELAEQVLNERKRGHLVGFIGGPPCPDFSVGGKNRGRHGENGRLSLSYAKCIVAHQPDWFVFENVKGLWRTKKHREFFDSLISLFEENGYRIKSQLMNSLQFEVAQDRDRIIVYGERVNNKSKGSLPEWETNMKYPERTAFDYAWPETDPFGGKPKIPDVPDELTVAHWFKMNDVDNHPNSKHFFKPRAGLAKFKVIEEGDTAKKSFKRLHRFRYSPTAAYGNNEVHLHPWLPRRLSAAEALAIQSLPKEFELPQDMTLSAMFKTIGNGVPFEFAHGIAKTIADHFEA